jgi:hypothetical protein
VWNAAGAMRAKWAKSHAYTAKGAAAVTASRVKFKASDGVSLKCGAAEITIDSSGIAIKGTMVTIEATGTLTLDAPAIGPM